MRERTDELLCSEARFRQVAALAELGVFALRTQELQPVLDRAIAVAAETLGTGLVKVVEVVGGVVVEDLRAARRFTPAEVLLAHGIVGGISVVIYSPGDEEPYGVFCVHATEHRVFTSNEISFLQTVANLVGATVAPLRAEALAAEFRALAQMAG